uniref:Inner centromere protein ARK-binding domain-containing protein n=1 Tax=Schistocephalus solidus TaxID=70667 RepID=A0A0X3PL06_SCHSO
MNVKKYSHEMREKVEKICSDLDSIIIRNFKNAIRKIQTHYPTFTVSEFSLEQTTFSQTTCSRIAEDDEMKNAVSSTPQANTTLKRGASSGRRTAAVESVSKAKKTRLETSPLAQTVSAKPEDTKTPCGQKSVLKTVDAIPPQSNQLKTPVRQTPPATTAPVLNQTYKKPKPPTNAPETFVHLISPPVALFGDTQHTPPRVIASPVIQPPKSSLQKSSSVLPSRSSHVSANSIMTEDSDAGGMRSIARAGETLASSSPPSTVSPLQNDAPTSAPSPPKVQVAPAELTSSLGHLPSTTSISTTLQTPWSSGAQTWLSRLGWLNSTASTAGSPLPKVLKDEGRSLHSQKPSSGHQTACQNLSKTQPRLNLKNTYTTPRQILASKRLLTTTLKQGYRPITTRPADTAIREASLPSTSDSTGALKLRGINQHLKSAVAEKQLSEQARVNDFIQRMAAKEERRRHLAEERERERLARVKAQREHLEAVRANALRLAKERQQLAAIKLAAEQRVQRQTQPQNSSFRQNKTSASFKQNISAKAPNCPPLLPQNPANKSNFTNQQQSASTQPQRVTNVLNTVFENFDCVVRPPTISKPVVPTATATSTTAKAAHPGQSAKAPSIRDSPLSYDMTGLLSEYDSDSENEARRKKRPIPSWARAGGKQLFELVAHCYTGPVKWQTLFRPAEKIHFTDEELFSGYKYRSRKRGSSVVWLSPSAGTCI